MAKQMVPKWLELKASGTPCPVGTHLRAVVTATPRAQRGAKRVREGAQSGGGFQEAGQTGEVKGRPVSGVGNSLGGGAMSPWGWALEP